MGDKIQQNGDIYQTKELLRVLSYLQYPVALLNLSGTIKWANPALERLWGYNQEELKRKKITFLYSKESRKNLPKIQEILTKDSWQGDLVVLRKDKTESPVSVALQVIRDDEGKPLSLLKLIQELTSQKAMEKQLIQSEKLIVIGTLAAGVAHELNQPLMVIRGYTQILLSNHQNDPELKDSLKRIEGQTTRMMKIIQHLRDFSRGSTGMKEPLSINQIIENAFTLLNQQLKAHNIEVIKELAQDLPQIKADANQLEQVIINLIVNARDALDQKGGGEIKVVSRFKKPDKVEVLVSDTGIGMPPHIKNHIFEPFFTTKEAGKGTGLGLNISQRIIKDHGGDISVTSTEGKGTTFVLTFPIYK
ncbi:MAG TPA: ATP-binding protein [Candidatus Limnocylindrales bacterium]|nr:ATP-binding protein [Candidatus Limnocylindrales bacterium]